MNPSARSSPLNWVGGAYPARTGVAAGLASELGEGAPGWPGPGAGVALQTPLRMTICSWLSSQSKTRVGLSEGVRFLCANFAGFRKALSQRP